MARTPITDRTATAQWLIRARKGAGMTNANKFLAALKAETGSAPNYATYAQWESGEVTPKDESLKPVVAFWAARNVEGPTAEATGPKLSPEEQLAVSQTELAEALRAMTTELQAMRQERVAWATRMTELEDTVAALSRQSVEGTTAPTGHGVPQG